MAKSMAAKTEVKKAKAATSPKKKPEGLGKDADGFRVGSKGAKMFALLKKGCTRKELEAAGGKAVAGFLAGIARPIDEWSAGREAIIAKDDKRISMISYKTKDGKVHNQRVAKSPAKKATKPRTRAKRATA